MNEGSESRSMLVTKQTLTREPMSNFTTVLMSALFKSVGIEDIMRLELESEVMNYSK